MGRAIRHLWGDEEGAPMSRLGSGVDGGLSRFGPWVQACHWLRAQGRPALPAVRPESALTGVGGRLAPPPCVLCLALSFLLLFRSVWLIASMSSWTWGLLQRQGPWRKTPLTSVGLYSRLSFLGNYILYRADGSAFRSALYPKGGRQVPTCIPRKLGVARRDLALRGGWTPKRAICLLVTRWPLQRPRKLPKNPG